MKKTLFALTMGLSAVICAPTVVAQQIPQPYTAGVHEFSFEVGHHDQDIHAIIWYPAPAQTPTGDFASNAVFKPVQAARHAPAASGPFPVVLFSHGWGGSYYAQSWLAQAITQKGAVVISVHHNNSYYADVNEKAIYHWTRAQDLSAALDHVLEETDFAAMIDQDRVAAAGFSYGGWTALSLGGARANHGQFLETCRVLEEKLLLCPEINEGVFDVAGIDPKVWNESYADPRVQAVFAIDPGMIWGLEAQDLTALKGTRSIVGLGDGTSRLLSTDFDASGLSQMLPEEDFERLAPASHFTAMPLCTARAADILKFENDDPVCTDPQGTDRAYVHKRLSTLLWDLVTRL